MAKSDILYFEIHHWVIQRASGGWTERDAENRLSALRAATRELVRANQANFGDLWMSLRFAGRSNATALSIDAGKVYLHEAFPLEARVGAQVNPQAVREGIWALMQGALAELAQDIYAYQVNIEDFGTRSPISYVADAGSDFSGALSFG